MFDRDPYVNRLQVGQLANVKFTRVLAAVDLETPPNRCRWFLPVQRLLVQRKSAWQSLKMGIVLPYSKPKLPYFNLERDDKT